MMGGRMESLHILRTLYRELRPVVNAPQKHVYETPVWKYIVGLCRNCKSHPAERVEEVQRNLEQTGRSYVLYLQGTREYHRIADEYKGAGERTAEDTARMLGFKMPHDPKDPPKQKSSNISNSGNNENNNTSTTRNYSTVTGSSSREMESQYGAHHSSSR